MIERSMNECFKKNQSDHDNQSEDKKISQLTKKKANLLFFLRQIYWSAGKHEWAGRGCI